MNAFLIALDSAFAAFWHISWQAGMVAVAVWGTQWVLRGQLTPYSRKLLWALVLIRLLMPWLPESAWSIHNVSRYLPREIPKMSCSAPARGADGSAEMEAMSLTTPAPDFQTISKEENRRNPSPILPGIWASGALLFLGTLMLRHLQTLRRGAKRRLVTDPVFLESLERCKRIMHVHAWLAPMCTRDVQTPALLGVLRPRLLLPLDWFERTSEVQRRHMILHELAHLQGHDLIWRWIWMVLVALHWFNPFVWGAFFYFRGEQELACDARVAAVLSPEERREYGETLLEQMRRLRGFQLNFGAAAMLERPAGIKRRIAMLVHFEDKKRFGAILGVVALVLIALFGLTESRAESDSPLTIIPGRGLAEIGVGDSEEVVREKYGEPGLKNENWLSYRNTRRIDFAFRQGIVAEMRFNRGFKGKSTDGIAIGSPLDAAVSASGGANKVVQAKSEETHGVKMGTDRVLYEMQRDDGPPAYKFIDAGKGILYWADSKKRITQIVTFHARDLSRQSYPLTMFVFAPKASVTIEGSRELLDAFNKGFPSGGGRTHHYQSGTVGGRLMGVIYADKPAPISEMLRNSDTLMCLGTKQIADQAAFEGCLKMTMEECMKQVQP